MKTKPLSHRDRYLELIHQFPLKRIDSDADHARAIDLLLRIEGKVKVMDGERQYADALAILIKEYETRHHQIALDKQAPVELLRHLMDEQNMTVSKLGKLLGSQPNASQILNGKRELSKAHIRKLAEYFKLNPGVFL